MNMLVQIDGFAISYDGHSVVTVTRRDVSLSDFADTVTRARSLTSSFERSKPGTSWGCDGVGYHAQQRAGYVQVHTSGVGPGKFAARLRTLQTGKAVAQ